jgi:hypothetical protein
MAQRRADELQSRMQKRLAELDTEKLISAMPPVIVGGAIVIPIGLLQCLVHSSECTVEERAKFSAEADARRKIELAAMKAVMDIETSLGYIPSDVSAAKVGYDIESIVHSSEFKVENEPTMRFIEVKGRVIGAETVTVTKNEILTAFNKPDNYILALCSVHSSEFKVQSYLVDVVYLVKPFKERPDFAATSVNYNISEMMQSSTVIHSSQVTVNYELSTQNSELKKGVRYG